MTLTSFKANMFDITRNIPSEFRPPEGFAIADLFDAARQEEGRNKEHRKEFDQHMTGKAVKDGVLTESQVSTTLAFAIASQASINNEIDAKRKQASADFLLLEELDRSIAGLIDSLKDKYGEDVIGKMAETYLTPEELEGLETDEEKMQAMVKKMVGPDGKVKEEYRHLLDPREIELLEKYHEAQKLAQEVNANVEANGMEVDDKSRELMEKYTNESGRAQEVVFRNSLTSEEALTAQTDAEIAEGENVQVSGGLDFSKLV